MVYEWLNPIYLDPEVQLQVREKFEEDSEIELKGFLQVGCQIS
jgi:Oxoglutarate and iron-dependent oxygenase degradation C-term